MDVYLTERNEGKMGGLDSVEELKNRLVMGLDNSLYLQSSCIPFYECQSDKEISVTAQAMSSRPDEYSPVSSSHYDLHI